MEREGVEGREPARERQVARDRHPAVLRFRRLRVEAGRFVVPQRGPHRQDGQGPQGRDRHALVAQPRIALDGRPERHGQAGFQVGCPPACVCAHDAILCDATARQAGR